MHLKMNYQHYTIIVDVFVVVAVTIMISLSINIYMLAAFSFLGGLAKGAVDNGELGIFTNAWVGHESGVEIKDLVGVPLHVHA